MKSNLENAIRFVLFMAAVIVAAHFIWKFW